MAWTYQDLKIADAALGIPDLAEATAELLQQTVVSTTPVAASTLLAVLWRTNEWGQLDRLYRAGCRGDTASYPILTGKTAADIFAAVSTTISVITSTVTITEEADWKAVLAQINTLVDLKVVSTATANGIKSLRTSSVQVWEGLTPGILQLARQST